MKILHKNIKNIERESAHDWSGARKLLLSDSDSISKNMEAMTKWYLQPGKVFDWHMHDNIDEYFIVLEWTWIITFEDDTEIVYKKDDLIYIPENIKHKIEATWDIENQFYFTRIYK